MIKWSLTVVLSPSPVATSSLQGHPEVQLTPDCLVWTICGPAAHLFAAWKQPFSSTETTVRQKATFRGAWSSGFSANSLALDDSKAKTLVSHRNFLTPNNNQKPQKAINYEKQTCFENISPQWSLIICRRTCPGPQACQIFSGAQVKLLPLPQKSWVPQWSLSPLVNRSSHDTANPKVPHLWRSRSSSKHFCTKPIQSQLSSTTTDLIFKVKDPSMAPSLW